jgi:hypothetical protein
MMVGSNDVVANHPTCRRAEENVGSTVFACRSELQRLNSQTVIAFSWRSLLANRIGKKLSARSTWDISSSEIKGRGSFLIDCKESANLVS